MREQSWDKIRAIAARMQEGPQEVETLAEEVKVRKRTIYRWIKVLRASGADIVKREQDDRVTYAIANEIQIG